jgi:hypothetical protein
MNKIYNHRKCHWCNSDSHIMQGHIFLCKKHYRLQQMRVNAKRRGKYVPSYEELEILLNSILDENGAMICPGCGIKMNLLAKDNRQRVITLQHNRDNTITFLCLSCNDRHYFYENDDFYKSDKNKKRCPKCKTEKELTDFPPRDIKNKRFRNIASYCYKCESEYRKELRKRKMITV